MDTFCGRYQAGGQQRDHDQQPFRHIFDIRHGHHCRIGNAVHDLLQWLIAGCSGHGMLVEPDEFAIMELRRASWRFGIAFDLHRWRRRIENCSGTALPRLSVAEGFPSSRRCRRDSVNHRHNSPAGNRRSAGRILLAYCRTCAAEIQHRFGIVSVVGVVRK